MLLFAINVVDISHDDAERVVGSRDDSLHCAEEVETKREHTTGAADEDNATGKSNSRWNMARTLVSFLAFGHQA